MLEEMDNDEEKYELEKMQNLMGDAGYEKENNALRYTIYNTGKKIYRVPLETDYRIFTPVARNSKKFKKKYKMITEIERLNGRIDRDYMFNDYMRKRKNGTNVKSNFYSNVNNGKGTYKK